MRSGSRMLSIFEPLDFLGPLPFRGVKLSLFGPFQHCVQSGAEFLSPRCHAVVDFRRHLLMHRAFDDAVFK